MRPFAISVLTSLAVFIMASQGVQDIRGAQYAKSIAYDYSHAEKLQDRALEDVKENQPGLLPFVTGEQMETHFVNVSTSEDDEDEDVYSEKLQADRIAWCDAMAPNAHTPVYGERIKDACELVESSPTVADVIVIWATAEHYAKMCAHYEREGVIPSKIGDDDVKTYSLLVQYLREDPTRCEGYTYKNY